jgi:hypothetical protein
MHPACMKKPIRKETVPLVAMLYVVSIEFEPVEKFPVVKSKDRQDRGYRNDAYGADHML